MRRCSWCEWRGSVFGVGNVAVQVDIVIQMAGKVGAQVGQRVASVAYEFAFAHFVLDRRIEQVDREQDERKAEYVDGVLGETELRVARGESFGELLEQQRQVRVALLGRLDLGKEAAQRHRQELILVVVQAHDVVEHRLALLEQLGLLLAAQLLRRVDELGDLLGVVVHQPLADQVVEAFAPVGVERQRRLVKVHEYFAKVARRLLFATGCAECRGRDRGSVSVVDGESTMVARRVRPRRLAQALPEDVVVGQRRPDTRGQAQIGGVQVFEYLQRQLGRHCVQVGKGDHAVGVVLFPPRRVAVAVAVA